MNTYFWGQTEWILLHSLPWQEPEEVIPPLRAASLMLFLAYTPLMHPCKYCRSSHVQFQRELNLATSLLLRGGPSGRPRVRCVTRGSVARYVSLLHDKVNAKLEKPQAGDAWLAWSIPLIARDLQQLERALAAFILVLCWNYPSGTIDPSDPVIARFLVYMNMALPVAFERTRLAEIVSALPLTEQHCLAGDDAMKQWAYAVACRLSPVDDPLMRFAHVDTVIEGFRSRNKTCSMDQAQAQAQAQTAEPKGCI